MIITVKQSQKEFTYLHMTNIKQKGNVFSNEKNMNIKKYKDNAINVAFLALCGAIFLE